MKHSIPFATAALVLASSSLAPASADVLNAGQVLRITFTVDNNFNTPPDVISLNFGLTNVLAAFTTRTAEIFDGNTSLGSHSDSTFGNFVGPLNLDPTNVFKTATSLFTFLNPAVIDFTAILDGTIDGRIDYTIQTGSHDIDFNLVRLTLTKATGGSGGNVVTPVPTITSIMIVDPGTFTSFCPGDGTGTLCPCGNNGNPGQGCANSTGDGGTLDASGSLSVGSDDMTMTASNLPIGQPALLFAGEVQVNGGDGVVFGDGLRCAGTNVKRLGVMNADGTGTSNWGPGLSAAGGWSAGDSRFFQGWYRDPMNSPCGAQFNLTHGVGATFEL